MSRTEAELGKLRSETARMQLDNACMWVCPALTNKDTCLDSVKGMDGTVRDEVKGKVRAIERLTSKTPFFVIKLAGASSRGHKIINS